MLNIHRNLPLNNILMCYCLKFYVFSYFSGYKLEDILSNAAQLNLINISKNYKFYSVINYNKS